MIPSLCRHHNIHTCGYLNWASAGQPADCSSRSCLPLRHPIAVRWLPSPPLGALIYFVRSDAGQRIPNAVEFECEKTGAHSASRASLDRRRSDGARVGERLVDHSQPDPRRPLSFGIASGRHFYTRAIWLGGLQILLVRVADCSAAYVTSGSAGSTTK
jgi:hypothetical protein